MLFRWKSLPIVFRPSPPRIQSPKSWLRMYARRQPIIYTCQGRSLLVWCRLHRRVVAAVGTMNSTHQRAKKQKQFFHHHSALIHSSTAGGRTKQNKQNKTVYDPTTIRSLSTDMFPPWSYLFRLLLHFLPALSG